MRFLKEILHPSDSERQKEKYLYIQVYVYHCLEQTSMSNTPQFDLIDPTQCINAKVRRLHRILNAAYQERIRPFGLQGSMLSMMFIIGKRGGVAQKELADLLVLDQSTVSRDIRKLEGKKWIRVSRGEDPRVSEVYLTAAGEKLLEEVTPVWQEIHQRMESLLGKVSIGQIDAITAAVHDELHTN